MRTKFDVVYEIMDDMDEEDKDNFIYEVLMGYDEDKIKSEYKCYVEKDFTEYA